MTGSGVPGSFGTSRPFLGTMITGDAHILIVHCIMPASSSLLMVLSAQGLNFNGIVYGADMQGGPSVGISMGGWVDVLMSYWSLLKMSEYLSIILSNFFFVSGDSLCFSWCCTGLFV